MENIASQEKLKNKISGILFDLGVSTRQLKDFKRGHINGEIALAYDIGDYLNTSEKISYIKKHMPNPYYKNQLPAMY